MMYLPTRDQLNPLLYLSNFQNQENQNQVLFARPLSS